MYNAHNFLVNTNVNDVSQELVDSVCILLAAMV